MIILLLLGISLLSGCIGGQSESVEGQVKLHERIDASLARLNSINHTLESSQDIFKGCSDAELKKLADAFECAAARTTVTPESQVDPKETNPCGVNLEELSQACRDSVTQTIPPDNQNLPHIRPECQGYPSIGPGCCTWGVRPECQAYRAFGPGCCESQYVCRPDPAYKDPRVHTECQGCELVNPACCRYGVSPGCEGDYMVTPGCCKQS